MKQGRNLLDLRFMKNKDLQDDSIYHELFIEYENGKEEKIKQALVDFNNNWYAIKAEKKLFDEDYWDELCKTISKVDGFANFLENAKVEKYYL